MSEKQLGYRFTRQVKAVKKMQPEGDDTVPFLRVTMDNGHRLKVLLDGSIDKEVLGRLRRGVIIEGTFDSIHGWTPEGQSFALTHTVLNADITIVEKGTYLKPTVDEAIEFIDWDKVDSTVQKAYAAQDTGAPQTAAGTPDMTAMAAMLAAKPAQ